MKKIVRISENQNPLELSEVPAPVPAENEILVKVSACGVCHTELDEIEGRTSPAKLPVILGHQIIGRVEETGHKVKKYKSGDRAGIAWIHSSCGICKFCVEGNDNLCEQFVATGRDVNGGYAEFAVVPEEFAFNIPDIFSDAEAAPLLCAGAIGYRSLMLSNMKDSDNLGLVGFGSSAHLVLQMARHKFPNSKIFVFARSEDERAFSIELGAYWAGDIPDIPPEKLHAAIDTTPVWKPVVEAMKNLERGGRLVINAIRKEDLDKHALLKLDYPSHLWFEKEIKSVANVSKRDVSEYLKLAAAIPIKPEIQKYSLEQANTALLELKQNRIRGAKVLRI